MFKNNKTDNKPDSPVYISLDEPDASGPKPKRRKRKIGVVGALWIAFGIFVIVIFLLFVLAYNGIIGYMPDIEELKNPTCLLYTSDAADEL